MVITGVSRGTEHVGSKDSERVSENGETGAYY